MGPPSHHCTATAPGRRYFPVELDEEPQQPPIGLEDGWLLLVAPWLVNAIVPTMANDRATTAARVAGAFMLEA